MSLEPLADYLESQFGNVYEYNLAVQDGFDVQPWTDELQQAVKRYLVHEATDDDYAAFLEELEFHVPPGDRAAQAEAIVEAAEPWEIAHAFHLAAVKAVPKLEELIGKHEIWPNSNLMEDVGTWLDAHAIEVQLLLLAKLTNHPERNADAPWYRPEPTGRDFTRRLTPTELLAAWNDLTGSAASDLTDDEWELLVPLLPELKNRYGAHPYSLDQLASLRRTFDGIRYKLAHDVPWSKMPRRYGAWQNVYQRYMRYRDSGHFARMLSALRGQPGATRVVTWLEEISGKQAAGRGTAD